MSHKNYPLKVGLFGIGLEAYWPQFGGLKERLEGYLSHGAGKLGRADIEVVDLGLIDSPEKALDAGHRFRQADVDILFLYVTTYALSSTVLPVVQRARVPVILLNLQPAPAIDYGSFNQSGGPHPHDGRLAGLLLGVPGAGNRQRFQPGADSVSPGDGSSGKRSRVLEGDPRLGGGRARRPCDVPQSPGVNGPLLQRNA